MKSKKVWALEESYEYEGGTVVGAFSSPELVA